MTYCLGWRYRNSAYLVGDTVFTNVPRIYRVSTFGEQHSEVSGEHVAELALKITEIAPGVAVAFAGDDVELAIDIVGFIRDNHSNFDTPEALFNALRINMELKEYVEILLACAPPSGPTPSPSGIRRLESSRLSPTTTKSASYLVISAISRWSYSRRLQLNKKRNPQLFCR
jgi:hypothetical protein